VLIPGKVARFFDKLEPMSQDKSSQEKIKDRKEIDAIQPILAKIMGATSNNFSDGWVPKFSPTLAG